MGLRQRFTWVTAVLLALFIFGAAAASAVAILLRTDWGHARVCSLLNRAVTQQIKGELRVGRIEALSLTQLTARDIKIIAPSGVPAIEAGHAVIDFSLKQLWAGEYGWSHADISHCLVRVSEDERHKINMEETFAKRKKAGDEGAKKSAKKPSDGEETQLDLQSMATAGCTLLIDGQSLPKLRLAGLTGIMRVRVLKNGDTALRFDRYKGVIDKGLPIGELQFHEVRGEVTTAGKRLLRFDGHGKSHHTPVDFELDIRTEPKKLVKVDAVFPEATPGSLSTLWVSAWSKLSPGLEIDVHYGKKQVAKFEKQQER
ncbi:MAG: hypothetical protein JWN04_5254 [Myxococcaceae bacterium]|nr:hypothetical protein [Myxococcaceae bacterium]